MKTHQREILLISIAVISVVTVMNLQSISQDLAYHKFADDRYFLGTPNFLNVFSNIPFVLVGIMGIFYLIRKREGSSHWSWLTLFIGVALVSIGSGYYHLNPNNETLLWDRLPMTIGFMGLFTAVLSEYVNPKIERYFLVPAILTGFMSILTWQLTDDLRFYLLIQFIPILLIPIILLLFKSSYTHARYIIYSVIIYLLAKLFELYDREIFSLLEEQFSGHSLKHIFASLGVLILYLMLKRRKTIQR